MKRLAVLLLVGVAACGAFRRDNDSPTAQRLRLCVQNATVGYGNITAHADLVRFDVMPGQQVCKMVPAAGPSLALTAQTLGGGARGPLRYGTRLQPTGAGCWRWRLTDSPTSSIDLTPCEDTDGRRAPGRPRPERLRNGVGAGARLPFRFLPRERSCHGIRRAMLNHAESAESSEKQCSFC